MKQTKKQSLIESITNVSIGYIISLLSLFLIFPLLGIESSVSKNLIITLYFTAISILRSYIIRRHFNNKEPKDKLNSKKLFCFECEIEMPTKTDKNGVEYCTNCGLIHKNNN